MIENLVKNNSLINRLYVFFGSLFFKLMGLFIKINNKQILFSSGTGKFIGDSPLCIYESLIKDEKYEEFQLIWAVKDPDKYANYKTVKINSFKYYLTALSSKVWITSVNIERGLNFKPKETLYVNTWHGIPLKYIGQDVATRHDYNFNHVDIFITSGEYENEIYKRAFNLKNKAIHTIGLPRNEKLLKKCNQDRNKILRQLNLDEYKNKKIILYAPTWKEYKYKFLDLDILSESLGTDYLILVKSHPLDRVNFNPNDLVIELDEKVDLVDSMIISDILISDYSSIMIDFALLGRPIYAYVPDFDCYNKKRGLYVSKEELAPNIVENEELLIKKIKNINLEIETKKTNRYLETFVDNNGIQSTKIIKEKVDLFIFENK